MTTKKINYEEAAKRFEEFHNEVEIVENTFVSWTKKAKFFDKIVQDYFESIPKDVFKNKSIHPDRRKEKKLNTFFSKRPKKQKKEKLSIEQITDKRKNTCLQKYGVDNPSKVDWVKKKKQNTSKENWNVEQPLAAKQIREKIARTNIEKYGGTAPAADAKIRNKMLKSNIERYGVPHYSMTETFKTQQSKIISCTNNQEITLKDWLHRTDYDKSLPSQITINQWFPFLSS